MKSNVHANAVCLNTGVWLSCLLALLLVTAAQPPGALAQDGARVKPANLAQLVDHSGLIVRGRVLSVTAEKHPQLTNLDTVVVTLRVSEVLKGQAGTEYTFREYVWGAREPKSTLGYRVGQDLLLMLGPPSRYGLSSPVGLAQGRFRIERDPQGNETAVNGRSNSGLMTGVEAAVPQLTEKISASARTVAKQHQLGPIDYSVFKDLIRGILAARQ